MTALANDNFNRANANPIGGNWTTQNGRDACQIVSNAVEATVESPSSLDAAAWYNAITWPNDGYSQVSVTTCITDNTRSGGVIFRAASAAATFYRARVRGPINGTCDMQLHKIVANVVTQLGSTTSVTFNSGDTVKGWCQGTSISAYQNGALIIGPITDSAIASGNFGIYVNEANGHLVTDVVIDNFEGGNLVSMAIAALVQNQLIGGQPL